MRFWLLGTGLVLAVHLGVSTVVSLAVALGFRLSEARIRQLGADRRAPLLLGLALLPSSAGLLSALLLVVPAWLLYEPRSTDENAGPVLLFLAAAGLALVIARAASALRSALRTREAVSEFGRNGRALPGLPLPAWRAPHVFPVAALAGVLRPRLLLADQVLQALDADEIEAVVGHELAHRDAHDNLKRLLLNASPDPLAFLRVGRRLRAAFLEAAESLADRRACARVEPLVLARALLKVAALLPAGQTLDLALASLHREGSLASRIRALLRTGDGDRPLRASAETTRGPRRAAAVLLLALGLGLGLLGLLLPAVHHALEAIVHLLA